MSRTHECPGGCEARVPRHLYACNECWYRLPLPHRIAIQQNNRHSTLGYACARYEAHTWYHDHPLTTKDRRSSSEGASQQ